MSISVIIPVYNVKSLLARCLDSLLAQSFTDWEAICVDDGSTDGKRAPPESANPLAEAEFLLFLQPHGKDFQIFRSRE